MPPVIIIGYGNPLRGDDGLGWYAAKTLADRAERGRGTGRLIAGCPADDLKVLAVQQLTPELAAEVAVAGLVVFIDADCRQPPGQWSCKTVEPQNEAPGPTTHCFSPGNLLALAQALYGRAPDQAVLLAVGGESFGYGQPLSPAAGRALMGVEQRLAGFLRELAEG